MDFGALIPLFRGAVPDLIVAYLFGSRARGDADPHSDVDLAVLASRPLAPLLRWELQQAAAELVRAAVDLVDLGSASTVMRARVLADAVVLAELDRSARARFETAVLGAYARLNEERRGILDDVRHRGSVYG